MLMVDVTLYPRESGGRQTPIAEVGFGCSCKKQPEDRNTYKCRINFYNKYPIVPGETRRADIFFLTGDDAEAAFLEAGKLYLYEGHIIGEARTVARRGQRDRSQ